MSALALESSTRAVMYLRISQDRTGQALGVERQREDCTLLAERLGWTVVEVVEENDTSAFSRKPRPGWRRVLGMVEAGAVDGILAWSSDRLYRRNSDLEELVDLVEGNRVAVETVAAGSVDLSTANGRMVARVMGSVAQAESEKSSERIARAMKQAAERGKPHGGPRPYGYERGPEGGLVLVPAEQAVVQEMAERALAGESIRSITVDLNERSVPSSTGGRWSAPQVTRTLRSPRIAGYTVHEGEIAGKAEWEPLLDELTWRRVRAKLEATPVGRRPKWALLSGLIECGECGHRMRSSSGSKPTHVKDENGRRVKDEDGRFVKGPGKTFRVYRCDPNEQDLGACGSNTIAASIAEPKVVEYLLGYFAETNLGRLQARRQIADTSGLVAEIARDEQALDDLASDFGARRLSRREWLAAREPIDARLLANRKALDTLNDEESLPAAAFKQLDPETWESLTVEQQRAVARLAVEKVVVAKGGRGPRRDTGRVIVVPR